MDQLGTADVLAPVRETFRAVAVTVVPEVAGLSSAEWAAVEGTVERALAQRPAKLRRQLRTFLRLIHVLPIGRFGRTFVALDPERRERVLSGLHDSRVFLQRRGFGGLRTLVLMGYYTLPRTRSAIGYRASPMGWEARR